MKRTIIDDPCELQGEGITRTSQPGATQWPYRIVFSPGRPLSGTIGAIDRHQAERFLKKRHPNAVSVTVLAQPGRGR